MSALLLSESDFVTNHLFFDLNVASKTLGVDLDFHTEKRIDGGKADLAVPHPRILSSRSSRTSSPSPAHAKPSLRRSPNENSHADTPWPFLRCTASPSQEAHHLPLQDTNTVLFQIPLAVN